MLALDLSEDVSTVWSPAGGTVSEPSRVAFDADGAVTAFGFQADLHGGHPHRDLRVTSPLRSGVWQPEIAESYLVWLLRRAGVEALVNVPVFLPFRADMAPRTTRALCHRIAQMGGNPLVIQRPLAAALALGVWNDHGPRCHLMIEVSERLVEVAVIAEGSVVVSCHLLDRGFERVGQVVDDMLRGIDPDDEFEIRESGMHVYGWAARREASAVIKALDLPLASSVGSGLTVVNGAKTMAEEVLPWLMRSELGLL